MSLANCSVPRGTTVAREHRRRGITKNLWFADNSRCPYEISGTGTSNGFFFYFFRITFRAYTIPRYLCVMRISVETWTEKKANSIGKKRKVKRWHRETKTEDPRANSKTIEKNVFDSCLLSLYEPYYTIVNRAFLHDETCCWIFAIAFVYIRIYIHTSITHTIYLLRSILAFNYLILSIGIALYASKLAIVESFPIHRGIISRDCKMENG